MKSRVQDKIQAISLRMQGYSYKQIMEVVPVSKGLLSGWLKYIKLNEEQQTVLLQNIQIRSDTGRANATLSNMRNKLKRQATAFEEAKELYSRHKDDPVFIAGVCLYWAEGSKRTSAFQFMNSDPKMICFMLFWIQKYLRVEKEDISLRLCTHADFKLEKYEDFWSLRTGIPISQFTKTSYKPNRHGIFKKNPDYKGCLRIEAKGGMALLRKVICLYEILNSDLEVLYSVA